MLGARKANAGDSVDVGGGAFEIPKHSSYSTRVSCLVTRVGNGRGGCKARADVAVHTDQLFDQDSDLPPTTLAESLQNVRRQLL